MLEFREPTKGNIISFHTKGSISKEDVKKVEELIEAKAVNYSDLRLHALIESFEGYDSVSALWKDLSASFKVSDKLEKVSIVTDKNWIENLSKLADRITDAEVKIFAMSENELAKNWIEEGNAVNQ